MRVLVTGATGYIGRHLVGRLLARGDTVYALCRNSAKGLSAAVSVIRGDVTDKKSLSSIPRNIDSVYHLAALVTFDPLRLPELLEVNCEGTRNLAESAPKHARFVYVSSACTVGLSKSAGTVLDENTPADDTLAETNPYMKSKLSAERALLAYAKDLHVTVVNPTTVYGPGDYSMNSGTLVKTVLSKRILPAAPGGSNVVDVRDVAEGIILAGEKGRPGGRYILGGQNMKYREIYKTIAEAGGRNPVVVPLPSLARLPAALAASVLGKITGNRFLTAQIVNDMFYFKYFSSARAESELGWRRAYDFRSTVERALAFYRAEGLI